MHVSGEAPGDSVTLHIEPGQYNDYTYDIPSYHAGGLHYYHPHKHGSITLQIGGGAGGMFIVDDDERNCPQGFLQDLPEILLAIQQFVPAATVLIPNDDLFSTNERAPSPFTLVNGLVNPRITINANEWYRFRMLHSASEDQLHVTIDGCEMILLAKDGMYLGTPRSTSFLRFLQPSRVDIAIRCPVSATPFLMEAGVSAKDTIATITVGDAPMAGYAGEIDISKWDWPNRPQYLADLRSVKAEDIAQTFSITMSEHGREINGKTFSGASLAHSMHNMTINTVEEWSVDITAHPLHVHVNPFQLQESLDEWDVAGDYVDTFIGRPTKVRTFIGEFTGVVFVHCHVSSHADSGLAAVFWVKPEGSSAAAAAPGMVMLLVTMLAGILCAF